MCLQEYTEFWLLLCACKPCTNKVTDLCWIDMTTCVHRRLKVLVGHPERTVWLTGCKNLVTNSSGHFPVKLLTCRFHMQMKLLVHA